MNLVERTEPITLDEVMEFVDSIEMNDIDKHQLKQIIADIADKSDVLTNVKVEIDKEKLIRALRCSSGVDYTCDVTCHYFVDCKEEDKKKFFEQFPDAKVSEDFFGGCDCDRICADAVTVLESQEPRFQHVRLSNGNEALLDTKKKRVYHSYMNESFMRKTGLTYKVVDAE